MARALFIIGDEPRFFRNIQAMRLYLDTQCRLSRLTILNAAELSLTELFLRFAIEAAREPGEPLLVVYSGHGLKEGWVPSAGAVITYTAVVSLLSLRRSPTVLINACCYPAAIFARLEKASVSPELVSVIAAGPADRVTYDGLVDRVAQSWTKGVPYEPFVGIHPNLRIGGEDALSAMQRLVIRMQCFLFQRFGIAQPWQVLDERRWGAVLDRHFLAH